MAMLPTLVGSPPRRESRRSLSYGGSVSGRSGLGGGGVTPSSPGYFLGAHADGGGGSGGANEGSSTPGPLQLSSPWSSTQHQQEQQQQHQQQHGRGSYRSGALSARTASAAAAAAAAPFSSSPGILQHEDEEDGMRDVAASGSVSPPGPPTTLSLGLSGVGGGGGVGFEAAKIVDFSPTWDFAPGGAKLLICLASPIDAEVGMQGPNVYFADRPVPVSWLVLLRAVGQVALVASPAPAPPTWVIETYGRGLDSGQQRFGSGTFGCGVWTGGCTACTLLSMSID